jgi:hypothetical protein
VQEPMNTVSIATSRIGVPAAKPMYDSALAAASRISPAGHSSGSGTAPSRGTPWPGLVPQVTKGDTKLASRIWVEGGLHLDTPRHDFPPQDLKYAKAVRVVPRPGWAVAAVLRVPVAAPVGSVRSCATTGRLPAGPRLLVAGGCGTAGRGCVSAAC